MNNDTRNRALREPSRPLIYDLYKQCSKPPVHLVTEFTHNLEPGISFYCQLKGADEARIAEICNNVKATVYNTLNSGERRFLLFDTAKIDNCPEILPLDREIVLATELYHLNVLTCLHGYTIVFLKYYFDGISKNIFSGDEHYVGINVDFHKFAMGYI